MQEDIELVPALLILGGRVLQLIVMWILFSIGLRRVLKKLEAPYKWMAWIPGLRYFALGNAISRPIEGVLMSALEIIDFLIGFLPEGDTGSKWDL